MTPLYELRKALTTIDRESKGYDIINGYLVEELDEPYINGLTAPSEYHHALTNDLFVVSAVAMYRGVVHDILADAIDRYPTQEKHGETGYAHDALRLARAINSRTEGAGK